MSLTIDSILRRGLSEVLKKAIFGSPKEEKSRVKSKYQLDLEADGWEFFKNVRAKNDLMDHTRNKEDFDFFREYCERQFPGKIVGFFKAHYDYGGEIRPDEKIFALYTRNKE